jgi:hypothetical protein
MEDRKTDRESYRRRRELEKQNTEDEYADSDTYEEKEMSFMETVFDNRENDWLGFARQQMEFYRNAGQYMDNLQIEINTIDEEIEDVMEKIEDANYNVAQGYKVFKELKDLRNERKEKENELQMLRVMTESFDMDAMAEAFSYNVEEIEKMTSETAIEEENREAV